MIIISYAEAFKKSVILKGRIPHKIILDNKAFKILNWYKGRIPHVYIFNVRAFENIYYKRAHTLTTITLNDNKYNSHMFKHLNDNCYQIINMSTI